MVRDIFIFIHRVAELMIDYLKNKKELQKVKFCETQTSAVKNKPMQEHPIPNRQFQIPNQLTSS